MDKKFEVKEKGIVQQIIALAASVIVVGVLIMIGLNLMAATSALTLPSIQALADKNVLVAANAMDINVGRAGISSIQNSFSLVSTTTGYYTILYLAVIGGLAIAAILGYLAFSMFRGGGESGGASL